MLREVEFVPTYLGEQIRDQLQVVLTSVLKADTALCYLQSSMRQLFSGTCQRPISVFCIPNKATAIVICPEPDVLG